MKITLNVTDKRITDLLHGHGGSYSPWLHEVSGKWNSRKGMTVRYDTERGEEGAGKGHMTITREKVRRGFEVFSRLPSFGDFMTENDDDLTFNCVMQCIIFGKLVFA